MQTTTNTTLKNILVHPYFSLVFCVSVFFILPRYGSWVVMVACAAVLSAYVSALPESFRSRSGSLTPAKCLVTAMWIATAVIAALTLMGELLD